jgi:hypothetical protein
MIYITQEGSMFLQKNELETIFRNPRNDSEPKCNFPLLYYEFFLQEIIRLGIEIITFDDVFFECDDYDYQNNFKTEYQKWFENKRNPEKTYLLIQHDVDNHPYFTKRMVAMEACYGIRSNIFKHVTGLDQTFLYSSTDTPKKVSIKITKKKSITNFFRMLNAQVLSLGIIKIHLHCLVLI